MVALVLARGRLFHRSEETECLSMCMEVVRLGGSNALLVTSGMCEPEQCCHDLI